MELDKKMDSETAYFKAANEGWSSELEEIACKEPGWAYCFARNVKGADIGRCQKSACKDPGWAYEFAFDIKEADIEKCQEAVCRDAYWAYLFARYVNGADIEKIKELCPEISDRLDEMVMEKVLK